MGGGGRPLAGVSGGVFEASLRGESLGGAFAALEELERFSLLVFSAYFVYWALQSSSSRGAQVWALPETRPGGDWVSQLGPFVRI